MIKNLIFFVILAVAAPFISAQETEVSEGKPEIWMKKKWDYAVNGYDTVAYFTVGEPVEGDDQFVTEYKGAKWRFSSAENLALFEEDPAKYSPQYGGHCAYGLGKNGVLVHGDPKKWTILDDKLYLNLNGGIQKKWLKKTDFYITNANSVWPRALTEEIEIDW